MFEWLLFVGQQGKKGAVAHQHDKLVQRVKEVLHLIGTYVMENPQGGLEQMYYMADWENKKKIIELCAFVWPFRKTTNLWTSGFDWDPEGVTGNGRCREKCEQGSIDPLTNRFKHFMALAVDPQRGPRGAQSARMTCGIPERLITEILTALAETQQLKGKVVLDLCAGFQSIRQAVLKAGATYIAVDVKGDRGLLQQYQPRRSAMVLCHNQRVLAVKCRLADGTCGWMVPGGEQRKSDTSLHHTALRKLQENTGLGHEGFRQRVRVGPQLMALDKTTYFAYALNSPIPQAELARSFAGHADDTILSMAWVSQREAEKLLWRKEDEAMLQRLWQLPLYLNEEGRGGC